MKMHNYAKKVRTHFKNSYMNILHHLRDYVNHPDIDFTRKNKLNPLIVLLILFKFSDHSIESELLSNEIIVKRQTIMNAISKFKISAFRDMFLDSLKIKQSFKTFHGYRLLAVDGTYFNYKDNLKKKRKRFLCVMFYDVLNKYYVDVRMSSIILSEIKHCLDMIKNIQMQSILIMDRGYCSVNLMAHCIENNQLFLIRAKDINSNGLLKKCKFKNRSFDTTYTFHLTRNQTLEYKKIPGYRFLSTSSNFDFIDKDDKTTIYDLTVRIVRFRLPSGKYETIITNLPKLITTEEIKELYHLRWNIETSFRDLKHTLGALYLHSKNQENIEKELYAKLTLYNYTQIMRNQDLYQIKVTKILNKKQNIQKYKTVSNFTLVATVVKKLLLYSIKNDTFDAAFTNDRIPIRNNRFRDPTQKITSVSIHSYNYRIAA